MYDLQIIPYNDVFVKVVSDELHNLYELSDAFTFEVPGARFHPKVRAKIWDGKIRIFNINSKLIYKGLIPDIVSYAESKDLKISIDKSLIPVNFPLTMDETKKYLESLNLTYKKQKIEPYDHQIDGVYHALNHSRCLLLSPTGSGKSLIIYGLIRHYLDNIEKKTLLIVPTIGLVSQMYSDFKEYSYNNKWDVEKYVHCIHGGKDKNTDKPIVVATWQSIYKQPKEYFEQFECVIVDEAHQLAANAITGILEKCHSCPFRIGLTGTLNGMKTNKMVIEGLTGKIHKVITTSELMDKDLLAKLEIECILLKYDEATAKSLKNKKYPEEIEYLIFNEKRNKFIIDLANNLKGNTLILFQYVEKHGEVLYELAKSVFSSNRKVFFVHGKTEVEFREEVRSIVESEENAVIIASVGVFSVGINIKRLYNIIFASPSKSRIRVLQSIGRQLRKVDDKVARLYDIGDDLHHKNYQNYTLRHFLERIKIYNEEKFNYKISPIKL